MKLGDNGLYIKIQSRFKLVEPRRSIACAREKEQLQAIADAAAAKLGILVFEVLQAHRGIGSHREIG